MRVRKGIISLGLIAGLAIPLAAPPIIFGQEAPAPEVTKRKVKTKVVPNYPPLAKQMNITGRVKIEATISAEGKVTSTKVVGGSPVLVDSAIEALKKWRFEPAPKDTTEVIEFEFNGNN
ncbi:MAG TPA: energy transducer TonB [Candidatus Acidoferrales bacterium]|nr:energy transducer TonB [Candidatus Acidoferrales bacterium]